MCHTCTHKVSHPRPAHANMYIYMCMYQVPKAGNDFGTWCNTLAPCAHELTCICKSQLINPELVNGGGKQHCISNWLQVNFECCVMLFIRGRVLIIVIVANCPVRFHDDDETIPLNSVVYRWKTEDRV